MTKKKDIYRGSWEEALDTVAQNIANDIDAEIMADIAVRAAVDPALKKLYDDSVRKISIVETRSKTMTDRDDESLISEDEMTGIFEAEKEQLTVREFITKLEGFLDETLESDARGNVFLSENGNGVCLNVLVGAAFSSSDEEVNQVNVIISPTDRGFLGSEGVSMDDSEYTDDPTLRTEDYIDDDEDGDFWGEDDDDGQLHQSGTAFFNTREAAREHARSTGAKFEDNGQTADDGKRWSTHEAFDNALSQLR